MVGLRLRCFIPPTTTELSAVRCNPSVISFEWRNSEVRQPRNCRTAAARLGGERPDPLLEAAVRAAFLRFQESLRPEPQFIDPYSSCLLSSTVSHHDVESKYSPSPRQYRLATKFIDDNLLSMIGTTEDLRQIVLLTDGMDTRPYRLNWPRSSVIFDISPQSVFNIASQKLKEAGAKVSRNCISLHVPLESTDLQLALCERGYNGNKPSLWAIQGLPMSTMTNLIDILSLVSSSAMKGSIFLGELPTSLAVESSQIEAKDNRRDRIQRLLVSHGFRVNATSSDYESDDGSLLFIAEQLQFSDAQMEIWRTHLERIEDEGDEEGFDEL
ncbi:O-methyltransferase 1, chloroplastic [Curcuma longa]|uniref:O-methyltransferase 1, chloroplastic n=1 Tax=Curcuma longa TaxID=136217 RepID=UPI003D9F1E1C